MQRQDSQLDFQYNIIASPTSLTNSINLNSCMLKADDYIKNFSSDHLHPRIARHRINSIKNKYSSSSPITILHHNSSQSNMSKRSTYVGNPEGDPDLTFMMPHGYQYLSFFRPKSTGLWETGIIPLQRPAL